MYDTCRCVGSIANVKKMMGGINDRVMLNDIDKSII